MPLAVERVEDTKNTFAVRDEKGDIVAIITALDDPNLAKSLVDSFNKLH